MASCILVLGSGTRFLMSLLNFGMVLGVVTVHAVLRGDENKSMEGLSSPGVRTVTAGPLRGRSSTRRLMTGNVGRCL